MQGSVKWFNVKKGYGFITSDTEVASGEIDIFVHFTGIKDSGFKTLKDGQRVEFKVGRGDRGLKAVEVTPLI